MIKLITFILCLSVTLCFGGPLQNYHTAVAKKRISSPTFLINQDFEGAGTPSDWYVSGATFDYTAAPLIGAESLRIATNNHYAGILDGAFSSGEIYGKFRINVETLPSGSSSQILKVQNGVFSDVISIVVQPSGTLQVTGASATSDTITAGTLYWIYWHYKEDPGGSTGIVEAGFTTTETRPTSGSAWSGITNSSASLNAVTAEIRITNGAIVVIDNFQIAVTNFN